LITNQEVTQVNLSAATGDMGVLAHHVPTIEPLRPGVVEVIDASGQAKKWFGKVAYLVSKPLRQFKSNS
jgi:F-type H+-transporting ATPase subunit delta